MRWCQIDYYLVVATGVYSDQNDPITQKNRSLQPRPNRIYAIAEEWSLNMIYELITDLVGNTSLVNLKKTCPQTNMNMLVKSTITLKG